MNAFNSRFDSLVYKYNRPIIETKRDGIHRALFANISRNDCAVFYRDDFGQEFVLYPPLFLAIEAFRKPHLYACAAIQGILNPERLNPSEIAA